MVCGRVPVMARRPTRRKGRDVHQVSSREDSKRRKEKKWRVGEGTMRYGSRCGSTPQEESKNRYERSQDHPGDSQSMSARRKLGASTQQAVRRPPKLHFTTTKQKIGQLDNAPLSRYHEGISQSSLLRAKCLHERDNEEQG